LGLPTVERNDRQRIMVFLLDGVRIGFIVDVVAEVLKIPHAAIEPAPQLSAEQAQLITRVANMQKQKRLIQLLDPAHLIAREQRQELASLADRAEAAPPTV
ncbi:MAG: chemotaxis protein CheW, partial [Chromatiaceae bacterium]|nr:chemotaxis protein CheW [Chromatiaceae bacterium]